ncbi:methionine/alanine import family NSS transporter small subunit [Promicromonospora sukumoe]|uniref:methionine/alanine import family NSS transporter small subunit n=1 Tax=Promicromonospora sukumoe TaxID=88382 RepID=UPI00037951CD|nr:methionine/alanine import family NSS transporter small subunit [Promicromonospora sukumoe]
MSGTAVTLLVVALVVVWGGLAVSIVALVRRPERTSYPAGGEDEGGPAGRPDGPVERDT